MKYGIDMKLLQVLIFMIVLQVCSNAQSIQFGILRAEVSANLTQVSIQYEIKGDATLNQLPFRAIGWNQDQIEQVRVKINEKEIPLNLQMLNQRVAMGNMALKPTLSALKGQTFEVTYELSMGAQKGRLTIPVVFPDLQAEGSNNSFFSSTIRLEESYVLDAVFPAMTWKEDKTKNDYHFELQVIPAWVKFHCYKGQIPFWRLERIVDVFVILVLLGLLLIGWKKIKL